MLSLPESAQPLLSSFSIAFNARSFQRALCLMVGMILCTGRHTVTAALRIVGPIAPGHFSSYHRLLSRARWSMWIVGRVLAAAVLELVPKGEPVVVAIDDTSPQHKSKNVYGKGRHHDACRSSQTHTVWVWGHKWVVLAVLVQLPFCSRRWALPVLAVLYRSEELDKREKRRHRTPVALARKLMAALLHWFPDRQFIVLGDGGFASHELARFCHRYRRRLTLVSLLHPRANLYDPPPPPKPHAPGRPRVKGQKLPAPQDVVAQSKKRKRTTVHWYGGGKRRVEFVSGTGHWYLSGKGLVPLRWVFVHDLDGTHRDQYFFSTDLSLSPTRIISLYTARWSLEVTFQEVRAQLGFHTPRSWTKQSVLRTAPCLLGLFSVVSLIYNRHVSGKSPKPACWPWYQKSEVSFGDAIAAVRRLLWSQTIFARPIEHAKTEKSSAMLWDVLLDHLCRAA